MHYGYFDDDAKEYVIERPDTPRSWTNYLGSTVYGAIITNNAGGYSFFHSAAQGRFVRMRANSVPMDQPGRYFYLRDRQSREFWSASWQPVGKPLSEYQSECRHGTAYTKIRSKYSGIRTEATYFVPLGKNFECWCLTITNESSTPRKLSLFTFVELAGEWHSHHDTVNLQYSQYIVDSRFDGRFLEHGIITNLPSDPDDFQNRDQSRHVFMTMVDADIAGFDTCRDTFLGTYGTYAAPKVVVDGKCTGSQAHGDNGCGTLQSDVDLAPGETRKLVVLLGVGTAAQEGRDALATIGSYDAAMSAVEQVKAHWHTRLGNFVVKTPDAQFNSMLNVWNPYNCLITYSWSRAASLVYAGERDGLGYRDTVQDIIGVVSAIPEEAGGRLELMITGQCASGGAMQVVKPFAHRPGHEPEEKVYRSDDCLWLFMTVPAFVKETGNVDFYRKVLPFADHGEATVFGHLRRALEFNLTRTGDHGLPCGLEADWNDAIKLGARGESVFVTFQLRLGLAVYGEIADRLDEPAEKAWATEQLAALDAKIQKHTWDGEWFVRAFRDDGSVVGTKDDPEGSIFLNPQSFAVLSGAANPEQAAQAMQSVKKHLATEYGIALCDPPFKNTSHAVVRAVIFNPGMKENAGIFCHPQGWAVLAETQLGHGDRAYEYYRAYMPSAYNERAEVRQIEPYVHCQSTHGKYSRRFGASRLPWLSGTAAWSYYSATTGILGVQPEYDGLRIDPCLPSSWTEIDVERRFRGKLFRIHVKNGDVGKGVRSLVVNGKAISGNLIPVSVFQDENQVDVELA